MMELSKADQKRLLAAMARLREEAAESERKQEAKVWGRCITRPFYLRDWLSGLTKSELDSIRQKLAIPGISALKKQELAAALEARIPEYFVCRLAILDAEQLNYLLDLADQGGISGDSKLSKKQLAFLNDFGCAIPGQVDGKRVLAMSEEVVVIMQSLDRREWQQRSEINSEWMRLTQGLLYYYGVLSLSQLHKRVLELAKTGSLGLLEYFDMLTLNAIPYYDGIWSCDEGFQYYRVFDSKAVVQEHKARHDVAFYPLLYQQIYKAGHKDFVERTFAFRRFSAYIVENYTIAAAEADKLVEECVYAIQIQEPLAKVLEFLQSNLEIDDITTIREMVQHIVTLSNTTRQWVLKGYTPEELSEREKPFLNPLPPIPFPLVQEPVDRKGPVGRNDPCPCGSGKKYKKCCGK